MHSDNQKPTDPHDDDSFEGVYRNPLYHEPFVTFLDKHGDEITIHPLTPQAFRRMCQGNFDAVDSSEPTEPPEPKCFCPAYPEAHKVGDGDCIASGNVHCPACAAILADDDVERVYAGPAYALMGWECNIILHQPCGQCGAFGRI